MTEMNATAGIAPVAFVVRTTMGNRAVHGADQLLGLAGFRRSRVIQKTAYAAHGIKKNKFNSAAPDAIVFSLRKHSQYTYALRVWGQRFVPIIERSVESTTM